MGFSLLSDVLTDQKEHFFMEFYNETLLEAEKINKIEVFVGTNEEMTMTLTIAGGKFRIVEPNEGKYEKQSSSKVINATAGTITVPFYVRIDEHGVFELKLEGKSKTGKQVIVKKMKTYTEDRQFKKFFDLRNKKFSSFYLSNNKKELIETKILVKGNLLGENLKNVEKLL